MSAANEAKNPSEDRIHGRAENPSLRGTQSEGGQKRARCSRGTARAWLTWEVVEEWDGGGAADDGVDPEPPPGPKYGAGDARAHDRPRRQEVVAVHRPAVALLRLRRREGERQLSETGREAALFSLVLG